MSIIKTTYHTTLPMLHFIRGSLFIALAVLSYMCLINSSLGFQLPLIETGVVLAACFLLSWDEKVRVSEDCLYRSLEHQLLNFVSISLPDIELGKNVELNIVKQEFGYYEWQVDSQNEKVSVLSTGKSQLFTHTS